jgi:oxygen-independent coproporphyrinogen-3 oxidase
VDFDPYFRRSLESLQEVVEAGFVELSPDEVRVNEEGRVFVRNVCMAFDRYLEAKMLEKPMFSRTV